jgi:hypothetical protein
VDSRSTSIPVPANVNFSSKGWRLRSRECAWIDERLLLGSIPKDRIFQHVQLHGPTPSGFPVESSVDDGARRCGGSHSGPHIRAVFYKTREQIRSGACGQGRTVCPRHKQANDTPVASTPSTTRSAYSCQATTMDSDKEVTTDKEVPAPSSTVSTQGAAAHDLAPACAGGCRWRTPKLVFGLCRNCPIRSSCPRSPPLAHHLNLQPAHDGLAGTWQWQWRRTLLLRNTMLPPPPCSPVISARLVCA